MCNDPHQNAITLCKCHSGPTYCKVSVLFILLRFFFQTHPPSPFLPAFGWPDQTAIRITAELSKLVSQKMFAWTRVKNFESNIVLSTLDACGTKKSHPYHPQVMRMVKIFYCSCYLCTTAALTSSLLQLMYGRHPQPNILTPYKARSYQAVRKSVVPEWLHCSCYAFSCLAHNI